MAWSFRICSAPCGTTDSKHAHLYRSDGEIGLLWPPILTKTSAFREIDALKELSGIPRHEFNENVAAMEKQVAESNLPDL